MDTLKDCTTCKNHNPRMTLDDIPDVCFECAYQEGRGLGYTEYDPDLGKLLANKLEEPLIFKTDGNEFPRKKVEIVPRDTAMNVQVGGDHYKKLKIQPMEYSMANKLDACQHTIIKYVTRFREKGGKADLEKAKHTIDLLIELENL